MSKKFFFRAVQLLIAAAVIIVLQKCGSDDSGVNPGGDFIAGTITFQDSNFLPATTGHYSVSFYNSLSQPPVRSDSLTLTVNGHIASSYYKSTGLASATYFIASTWTNRSTGAITILGEYGCDTPPSCSTPTSVEFPNYAGTGTISFKSKTQ